MTHTQYESYMTHLEDLVVFLLFFLIIRPSPLLNEITIQTGVGGLFVQILPLNFTVTAKKRPQMAGLREQRCIENLKVGWPFLAGLMSRLVILFNYEVFTFLIMSTLM